MLIRLGHVIFWLAIVAAALVAMLAIGTTWTAQGEAQWQVPLALGATAALIVGAGTGIRYILAGESTGLGSDSGRTAQRALWAADEALPGQGERARRLSDHRS